MRNDHAVSTALGDDTFARIVRGVHVDVWHRAQQLLAPREARVTKRRARKPLHGAVHAKVDNGTRLEIILQPLVVGGILRMRREITLEEQTHRVAFDAERRLNADEHVAEL